MSVALILATIDCDGCGQQFRVEIDPARQAPVGWSMFDMAEDAVRGGAVHSEVVKRLTMADLAAGSCSVQGDDARMLCIPCTNDADAEADTVEFGGRSYRKIIPVGEPVDDGSVRCAFCGQLDEPEAHDDALCPVTDDTPSTTGEPTA